MNVTLLIPGCTWEWGSEARGERFVLQGKDRAETRNRLLSSVSIFRSVWIKWNVMFTLLTGVVCLLSRYTSFCPSVSLSFLIFPFFSFSLSFTIFSSLFLSCSCLSASHLFINLCPFLCLSLSLSLYFFLSSSLYISWCSLSLSDSPFLPLFLYLQNIY